jgi:hypothetical protein
MILALLKAGHGSFLPWQNPKGFDYQIIDYFEYAVHIQMAAMQMPYNVQLVIIWQL